MTTDIENIEFLDEAPPELSRQSVSKYDALRTKLMETGKWARIATFDADSKINAQQRAGSIRTGRGSWKVEGGQWETRIAPHGDDGFALWVHYLPATDTPADDEAAADEAATEARPRRARKTAAAAPTTE